MTTKRFMRAAALAVSSLALSACTLAVDLDRFEKAELCTVDLVLTKFQFHSDTAPGHTMFFRLVKRPETVGGTPSLRALAILEPTPAPDFELVLPNAVRAEDGPFDVDFFADVDGDGLFTPSVGGAGGMDHSWILADVCATPSVAFEHVAEFDGFDDPQTNTNGLTIDFTNMPVTGGALEVQLLRAAPAGEAAADRTVGLFRKGAVDAPEFSVELPGTVDPDPAIAYEVRIWADANGNGAYELGEDDSWIVATDGGALAAGPLAFDFALRDANREDVERILVTLPGAP